jgi:hypothetical protein
MMQKKENQFRGSIHKHMVKEKPHQEKTNNPYRGGIADDWYSGTVRDCWVEYKWKDRLTSIQADRFLSPLQYRWLTERHKEGRLVFVIVGFPQGGIVIYPKEFSERIPVVHVQKRIQKRKQLAEYLTRLTMGEQ